MNLMMRRRKSFTAGILIAYFVVLGCNRNGIFCSYLRVSEKDIINEGAMELIDPPQLRIDVGPANAVLLPGHQLELQCDAFGNPPPTIIWYFNERPIGELSSVEGNSVEIISNFGMQTIQKGNTLSKLHLDCIDESKAGVYSCVAQNGHYVAAKNATVEVKDSTGKRPKCLASKRNASGTKAGLVPARIYMWTNLRMEVNGANVQLFCRAHGNPSPKIRWFRESEDLSVDNSAAADDAEQENDDDHLIYEEILSGGGYEILPNGDLFVQSKELHSVGGPLFFRCTASNALGSESVESFVYLADTI